jgi:hypothetical protein
LLTINARSWIFIIEGIITCLLGILAYFYLVSFPDDEKHKSKKFFLNERERQFVVRRINADRGDAVAEPFKVMK